MDFRSVLKVRAPCEGTAFIVANSESIGTYAVTCFHVAVPLGGDPNEEYEVQLECYLEGPRDRPVRIKGRYLPNESDPEHDIAVLKLDPPPEILPELRPLPLSYQALENGEEVMATGFPEGQEDLNPVHGTYEKSVQVVFKEEDGSTVRLEVLRFDTYGHGFGRWGKKWILRGMSGGPILTKYDAVIAIIEGRQASGALGSAPQGYGISLGHLWKCSSTIREYGMWKKGPPTIRSSDEVLQPWVDHLRTWVVTHKIAVFAILLLAAGVGYLLLSQTGGRQTPPPPLSELDLLEKALAKEAQIGGFEPYGKVECRLEDSRLYIHYSELSKGYNGCYINFSFNTADYRTLVINANGPPNEVGGVPKEFTVELKQGSNLDIVTEYVVFPSGQDISKPVPRKGRVDQITIVFWAEKVGSPEGTLYIHKFVLSPNEGK